MKYVFLQIVKIPFMTEKKNQEKKIVLTKKEPNIKKHTKKKSLIMHEQISLIHGEKTELLLALILRIFWRSRIFPFIIIVVLYILYFSLLIPYILSYHFTTTASKAQRNLYRSVILYSRMHLFSIIFSFILLYTSLSFCHCTIWLFAICISTSCFEGYQVVYTIWRLWIASLLLMYLRVVIDLSTMAFTDEVFFHHLDQVLKIV